MSATTETPATLSNPDPLGVYEKHTSPQLITQIMDRLGAFEPLNGETWPKLSEANEMVMLLRHRAHKHHDLTLLHKFRMLQSDLNDCFMLCQQIARARAMAQQQQEQSAEARDSAVAPIVGLDGRPMIFKA